MAEILVIDYKLMCFNQHHNHRPLLGVFSEITRICRSNNVTPSKIVFAVDIGKSKRSLIYPAYKGHRKENDKKATLQEQERKRLFEQEYRDSITWLSYFGNVIDINGIEADDIGAIIANRFANTDTKVTLLSSDKDWASFLFADNIRMLNIERNNFITLRNCVEEYGLDPLGIFYLQVFAGSTKENVKGLYKFGIKTFIKLYDNYSDFNTLKYEIKELLNSNYRGICLPDESTSYDSMVELNYTLFKPVTLTDLSEEEQKEFLVKFSTRPLGNSYEELSMKLLQEHSKICPLSPVDKLFFKMKD
jgi:5'-3' exonuclease